MKKKLVLVTTTSQTFIQILGGQPGYLQQYYDVYLITSEEKQLKKFAELEGVTGHIAVPMKRRLAPFSDLWSVYSMIKALNKVKPDIVHSYTPKAGLVSALAGCFVKKCVVGHTFTGLIFPFKKGIVKFLFRLIDKTICFLNEFVVAEGKGVQLMLEEITNKDICIIGNGNIAGVDLAFFNVASIVPMVTSDYQVSLQATLDCDLVFCFIGRLNNEKGVFETISAFSKFAIESRKKCHLIIAGGIDLEDPLDEWSQNQIKQNSAISWVGEVKDIRDILRRSHIHILVSYREGFPNVVLQANAMGVPSIVSDICGSNEIITPGFNGWIVPPKSVDALLETFRSCETEDISKLGLNASANVSEKYERWQYIDKLKEFYEKI